MDVDVFKLFAKRVVKETLKWSLFTVVLIGAGFLFEHLFSDWENAFIVGFLSLSILAMIGMALKSAWDIAKIDVEYKRYKRRWGKE